MARKQDEDDEPNTIEVINVSGSIAKFELDGVRYALKPRESCQINKIHARPRLMQPDRDPVASSVELLTDKRVLPVSDSRARAAVLSRDAERAQSRTAG